MRHLTVNRSAICAIVAYKLKLKLQTLQRIHWRDEVSGPPGET
jgi:hypothetical protein